MMQTKDVRKSLRRERISGMAKSSNQGATKNDSTVGKVRISYVQPYEVNTDQVTESLRLLQDKKVSALEAVSDIRVLCVKLDSERCEIAEARIKGHFIKLENEAQKSANLNSVIEEKWIELKQKEIPSELQFEIQKLLHDCNQILKNKDNILEELRRSIREKDEEYVETLRKQESDVRFEVDYIDQVCSNMQNEYEKQSTMILNFFRAEREKLISSHSKEVEQIFQKRIEKEEFYIQEKIRREINNRKELDDLKDKLTDEYSNLKIELESNIQTLNQQFEEIKATYQLNAEKLEYNFKVLTEIDGEKIIEREKYKRKISKIKDQLNSTITKYHDMEKSYHKITNELTEDYRELTKRYKDLQIKFKHFEIADTTKYQEVWLMHQDEFKDIIQKMIEIDKQITEEHLGLVWSRPDTSCLENYEGTQNLPLESSSAQEFESCAVTSVETMDINSQSQSLILDVPSTMKNTTEIDDDAAEQRLQTITNYWNSIANIIPDECVQTWRQLLRDKVNEKTLLDRRNSSLKEIEMLNERIQGFKEELNSRLGNVEENSKFQISPLMSLKVPKTSSIIVDPSAKTIVSKSVSKKDSIVKKIFEGKNAHPLIRPIKTLTFD